MRVLAAKRGVSKPQAKPHLKPHPEEPRRQAGRLEGAAHGQPVQQPGRATCGIGWQWHRQRPLPLLRDASPNGVAPQDEASGEASDEGFG
jgi:hypothetical protein